ncbi:MAG: flagellar hook-associated protein FlgL [Chloroflexota bacterium]
MRITNAMLVDTVLNNLNRNVNKLEKLQTQLTSGKRLSRPSDDPSEVGRALNLSSSMAAGAQHVRNMEAASDWLSTSESSLGATLELLQRVRELTVQSANDTVNAAQRTAIATEVSQLLDQMVAQGNSTLGGKRLFAGFLVNANPFTLTGPTVTYSGDAGQMLREIDAGSTIQINVNGSTTFSAVFATTINVRDHLLADDSVSLGSVDLTALDSTISGLLNVRADVGARINRLEGAKTRQELLQVGLAALLSKVADTDFAQAITEFSNQENVYKAALAAGSKAIQPSLLDYLR